MALASGERAAPAARETPWPRSLLLAALATEALLIAGISLPLSLWDHPPSLQTNLARVYGEDIAGLLRYLLWAAALLVAYAVAVALSRRLPATALPAAVGATALFAATLVPSHPSYSSDVFHYVATARVGFAHGENPHTTPPERIEDDPLMALSGWKWLPSPYGPAWTWLSALPYAASGGATDATRAVLAFKALAALCLVGATAAIALAAERLKAGGGVAAAVLFGWNPLTLIHLAGDGHNDAAMLLLIACAVLALAHGRAALSLGLLAAACLIKAAAAIAAVMLAVALLRRRRWRELALGTGASFLLGALLIAPYWAGAETFRAMLDEGRYFTNTPASLLQRLLEPSLGGDPSRLLVGGVARALLALIALLVAWRWRALSPSLIAGIAVVYVLAAAVLGTWYQPWYATWPLIFTAALVSSRIWCFGLAIGLTVGGLMVPVSVNFLAGISGRGARDGWIDAATVAVVLLPLALGVFVGVRASRRGPTFGGALFSRR